MQQNDRQTRQDQASDELDPMLDSALQKYGAIEPREGLEDRVFAHLQSNRLHAPSRTWRHWAIGAAVVATLALLLAVIWRPRPESHPTVAQHPAVSAPEREDRPAPHDKAEADQGRAAMQAHHRHLRRASPVQLARVVPKLNQFPSPQPLGEQEKMLANYVESYPERAAVLARLRAEDLRRDRLERMKNSPAGATNTNSDEWDKGDTTER